MINHRITAVAQLCPIEPGWNIVEVFISKKDGIVTGFDIFKTSVIALGITKNYMIMSPSTLNVEETKSCPCMTGVVMDWDEGPLSMEDYYTPGDNHEVVGYIGPMESITEDIWIDRIETVKKRLVAKASKLDNV